MLQRLPACLSKVVRVTPSIGSMGSPKRVIVVGAGWAGLAAARTYLEVDPTIDLTIIDSDRTLGGVWSQDRVYPGLIADSPVGLFDFSDLPMSITGLKDLADLPAKEVYNYLCAYASKFKLDERMKLSTTVSKISKSIDTNGWDVEIEPAGAKQDGGKEVLTCDKLIVAAGLASNPNWPSIPREDFTGLVMHSKSVGLRHSELTSAEISRVTVYGGCKSALDAIMLCHKAGKKVDWVIREEGNGPGMMAQVRKGGYHAAVLMGRWKAFATPSLFKGSGFWYNFLHSGKNKLGTWIIRKMWSKMGAAPLNMEPYKTQSENIRRLLPESKSAIWQTASVNTLHGDEEFLRQLHQGENIKVHRATIISMSGTSVVLDNGETLPSDAVVFATGWEPSTSMFSASSTIDLGVPAPLQYQDTTTTAYWHDLATRANADLRATYPILDTAPDYHKKEWNHTPFRLYRHIVPHSLAASRDRSLIFLGYLTNLQTAMYCEVAGLWGISWMEGLLPEKSMPENKQEMDYDIARFNQWCEMRYLSRGQTRMVAGAEIQDIIDLLMTDMGLEAHRKKGIWSDQILPYRAHYYKGIVEEVLKKAREKKDCDCTIPTKT